MDNALNKNLGLSEQDFNAMCQKLRSEEDQALFEHMFVQHFDQCQQQLIEFDKALRHLAYDATMDAFISFRNGVFKGSIKYGNLNWLLKTMARQHYYKLTRRPVPVNLAAVPEPKAPEILQQFSPETHNLLRKSWKELGEQCRTLLRWIYYNEWSYEKLAKKADQTQAVMRKRKQRCLAKLRKLTGLPERSSAKQGNIEK